MKNKGKKLFTECKRDNELKRIGRPKGSKGSKGRENGEDGKNGHTLNDIPKKRGRPKKIRNEEPKDNMPPIITVTFKFIGYCPECKVSIGDNDFKNNKFICTGCGATGGKKELLKEVHRERPRNKREYMEIYYANYPSTKEKMASSGPYVSTIKEEKVEEGEVDGEVDGEIEGEEKDIKGDIIEAASDQAPLKTEEDAFFEDNIDGLK